MAKPTSSAACPKPNGLAEPSPGLPVTSLGESQATLGLVATMAASEAAQTQGIACNPGSPAVPSQRNVSSWLSAVKALLASHSKPALPTFSKALALFLTLFLTACSSLQKPSSPKAKPALGPVQWTSYDGKTMPWEAWPVAKGKTPRAVVIAIHGLSGATSDFWPLGQHLSQSGIAVYAYDLRGQGRDPVKANRGDIYGGRQWLRDLHTFHRLVQQRHPRVPILWYGESLGSLIALHGIAQGDKDERPTALILSAPLAGLKMRIPFGQRLAIIATSRVLPRLSFRLGTLGGMDEDKVRVTSSSTHGGQMAKTAHHVEAFSLRLIREISQLLDDNPQAAREVQMPVLFLASPNDVVASPQQVQDLFGQLSSKDKRLHWYTRSYHLLLHDVQREQVLRDVSAWIERRR